MKVTASWLTAKGTADLMQALHRADHHAWFVGGCVRNALLGLQVTDIDISTDAEPFEVTRNCESAGFRVIPTGIEHGTVTVIAGGLSHEVTTLRRDVETFGRHAIVGYSKRIEDDAARRDFTMNAVYALSDGTVVDPLGGLSDLLARRVRFVGNADTRIMEDHLRILRFFRFQAVYGDPDLGIDAESLAACAAHSAKLETLSGERIGAEMRKLLTAADPAPALAAMEYAGCLAVILPGATARAVPILIHLEQGNPRSWLCRLAVLGGNDAHRRLRLSRAESTHLQAIVAGIASVRSALVLGFMHGASVAGDIVHAKAALLETPLPADWQKDVVRGENSIFPVTADDLMPDLQGKSLGDALHALKDRWIGSELTLTREQLLAG